MWTVAGLAADLAAGRTSSRELLEQSLARIADAAGEGNSRVPQGLRRDRPRRGGSRRSPARQGHRAFPRRRPAGVGQGSVRRRRRCDARRLEAVGRCGARAARRAAGGAPAGRRRADHRAHQHGRIRLRHDRPQSPLRHAAQSLGPGRRARPRRLLVGRRGGAGRWHVRDGARQRYARFDPPAGGLVRRDGVQADRAARAARGRVSAVLHPRFDRPAGQYGRLLRGL